MAEVGAILPPSRRQRRKPEVAAQAVHAGIERSTSNIKSTAAAATATATATATANDSGMTQHCNDHSSKNSNKSNNNRGHNSKTTTSPRPLGSERNSWAHRQGRQPCPCYAEDSWAHSQGSQPSPLCKRASWAHSRRSQPSPLIYGTQLYSAHITCTQHTYYLPSGAMRGTNATPNRYTTTNTQIILMQP